MRISDWSSDVCSSDLHDIKGQGIYAYVTPVAGEQESEELRKELVKQVRTEIGPTATPDHIQWAPGLPKTRSRKIMRLILRKHAENAPDQLRSEESCVGQESVSTCISQWSPCN